MQPGTAHAIDVQVVHDAEEPGAHVGHAAPQVRLGPGPLQRVLHQIVGVVTVVHQCARIAAQARHPAQQACVVLHRGVVA
ncbi:hypothetical protein D9M68_939870 [compost metagenome]